MATLTKLLGQAAPRHQLRPFDTRRDLSAVADLIETCFADTLDESGRDYLKRMRATAKNASWAPWGGLAATLNGAPLAGYVWEEEGRLIGNASLIPYFSQGRWYYLIANVAVLPEYRRQGIGRRLTQKCIEHTRQRHFPSVWLHVRHENEGAKNLYLSLGFVTRACRTTWLNSLGHQFAEPAASVKLTGLHGRDWPMQRAWLERAYPPELTWHMHFQANALRPDLWGGLVRFIQDAYIQQWGAFQGEQLLAALSWQTAPGAANYFWLAAPPDLDESVLRALLLHTLHHLSTRRPVTMDYPAGQFEQTLKALGFIAQQTLDWMELKFSP